MSSDFQTDVLIAESAEVRRRCQPLFEQSRRILMDVHRTRRLLAGVREHAKVFRSQVGLAPAVIERDGDYR